jgi:acyl-CoA dehydrogenase
VHNDLGLPYLRAAANEEQKQRWFPGVASGESILALAMTEPGTGSDLSAIAARAKKDGDDYIVNGAKTFISNGINADLVVTAVRTGDDPHRGLSMMVIERGFEGFERGKQIHKRGQHANDTAELFFNDCRVPAENLLGEEGTGFAQLMAHLIPERLGLAVSSMAACEAALAMTLEYVKERKAFGRPIGSFQNSRFVLADLQTKVDISRCWMDRTIARYTEGTCTVQEAAQAKYWTTDLLSEVSDACVQLFGGYGYTTEYKISEIWADARVNRIYAGTNEIMKELVGRSMGL